MRERNKSVGDEYATDSRYDPVDWALQKLAITRNHEQKWDNCRKSKLISSSKNGFKKGELFESITPISYQLAQSDVLGPVSRAELKANDTIAHFQCDPSWHSKCFHFSSQQ